MSIQIKGNFKAKGEVKEISEGKTITKFYLDIDINTQYPGICELQFFNDRIDIANMKPGEPVTVDVNISGRKWKNPEGKEYFFQSLNAWRIKSDVQQPKVETTTAEPEPIGDGGDDLPF